MLIALILQCMPKIIVSKMFVHTVFEKRCENWNLPSHNVFSARNFRSRAINIRRPVLSSCSRFEVRIIRFGWESLFVI